MQRLFPKRLFAWDFHGTLEQGNDKAVLEIMKIVLANHGIDTKITMEDVHRLYGDTWYAYFREFAPGKKIDLLVEEAVRTSEKITRKYLKPADYATEVLSKIKEVGDTNAVISLSREYRLKDFIECIGIEKYIDIVRGVPKYIERGAQEEWKVNYKAEEIKARSGDFDRTIVIGDREADVAAGKLCGATTYLIRHDGRKVDSNADFVITDLREVLNEYK
jgi:phosphoglycolate phosphatase-like HAD superfamily hydrolase